MDPELPGPKEWLHPRLITEHAFDKLRLLDCTFAEFDIALSTSEVIEQQEIEPGVVKELVLVTGWQRPFHLVVVVDDNHHEERVVTVYEPDAEHWSADYRRRQS